MTIVWHDAELVVRQPVNPAQVDDLERWLPGLRPGDPAAGTLDPVV